MYLSRPVTILVFHQIVPGISSMAKGINAARFALSQQRRLGAPPGPRTTAVPRRSPLWSMEQLRQARLAHQRQTALLDR